MMHVKLFTDGAARGNPDGPGGYGVVLEYVDPKGNLHQREFSGGYVRTTNNRMELLAVIIGLEALTRSCHVTVYSDSKYVVEAFNQHWIDSWIKKGWKRSKNEPVKNVDLWKRLLLAKENHQVEFCWVKGHDGHPQNERCDQLAKDAADGDLLLIDEGLEVPEVREPCFDNLLKVLRCEKPDRPTLFEFFLNGPLYEEIAGPRSKEDKSDIKHLIKAFQKAGYDYVTVHGSDFSFPVKEVNHKSTYSLNDGAFIVDRESFADYEWPDPDSYDYSRLRDYEHLLPAGMKVMLAGPGGVLENTIRLVGYENLCYILCDDEELAESIFHEVGSRILRYYENGIGYDSVGVLMGNDDWGFKTQTMISPADMRKYVFPWHKKMVELAHKHGKPAILHSCGQLEQVMEDIIEDIKYDGKHSFEDGILTVEKAYEKWGGRIAILGGIDLDYICRSTPEEIKKRAKAMLEQTKDRGGYALGTGNSVPEYVPWKNYFAMISVIED